MASSRHRPLRAAFATMEVMFVLLVGLAATGFLYWRYAVYADGLRADRFLAEVDAIYGAAVTLYDPKHGYAAVSNVSVCGLLAGTGPAAAWCQYDEVEVSPAVAADPDDATVVAQAAVRESRLLAAVGSGVSPHGLSPQWFLCPAARGMPEVSSSSVHAFASSGTGSACPETLGTLSVDEGFPDPITELARSSSSLLWAAGYGRDGEREHVTDHDGDGVLDPGDARVPLGHPSWHHLRLIFLGADDDFCAALHRRPLPPAWRAVASLTVNGTSDLVWPGYIGGWIWYDLEADLSASWMAFISRDRGDGIGDLTCLGSRDSGGANYEREGSLLVIFGPPGQP